MRPDDIFHSFSPALRKRIHIILVRPETGGNIGAAARALENMGINGRVFIVGTGKEILDRDARRFSKHAVDRLAHIEFVPTLESVLKNNDFLSLAATARIASSARPHPVGVRGAVQKAMEKLQAGEVKDIAFVFGPESNGMTNDEVAICDWVVTIPASSQYSSLNLAQAILVFAHEANMFLTEEKSSDVTGNKPGQRGKLIEHALQVAELAGFVLPGDPYKMKPRLEALMEKLPRHIEGIETWHGLLAQVARSLEKGSPEYKGRYKVRAEQKLESDSGSAQ